MGILTIILTILLSIGTYILGLFNGAEMERNRKWEIICDESISAKELLKKIKGIDAIKRTAKRLNERDRIIDTLQTMTTYYFKGGEYEDQDLYCEDIANKILEDIEYINKNS